VGFSSRPFVLCGLPVRKPPQGDLLYERRNGNFVLQVTGHPHYGLPFGQDRIVPIYLATLAVRQQNQTIRFRTAAEMLETFGMHRRRERIPAADCGVRANLRSHHFLRHRRMWREIQSGATLALQFF
jgi:hypothetical protein